MEDRGKQFIKKESMSSEDRGTQIKVGIFILIGLVTVGLMVVYFGRLGEGLANYYNVRVEFSNASGLLRGSEVLLAGAKVGRVTNPPTILPDMRGIYVDVRILDAVQIPVGSKFCIGSSGLLGDKFIEIRLDRTTKESAFIQPNATIQGTDDSGGIGDMAAGAGELIADLRKTVGNINDVVKKLDSTVLSKEELAAISTTIKNLESATGKIDNASGKIAEASGNIADASLKVDGLIVKADAAIQSGKDTMDSAKAAADQLQKTLVSIKRFVDQARSGNGVLGTLVSNREMAENLRALIINLRKHGILWYKDSQQAAGDTP